MTKRLLSIIEFSLVLMIAIVVAACSQETFTTEPASTSISTQTPSSAPITKTQSSAPVPTSISTPSAAPAPASESTPAPASASASAPAPSSTDLVSSKPIVLPGDKVMGGSAAVVNFNLEDLIKHSKTAVIGKVTEILPPKKYEDSPSRGFIIYTDVVIQAERYLYGSPKTDRFAIRVDGGRIGDVVMVAEEAPEFFLGEECIVFLTRSVHNYTAPEGFTNDNYYIVWAAAKYNIRDGILVNNSNKKFSLSDVEQEIAKTQKK